MGLENQVALVTGGSRGIGRAVCIRLAQEGADIVINYAGNEEKAQETARACEAYGVRTLCVKGDVADPAQVDALFQQAMEFGGRIDILVNNAGITRDNIMLRMKPEDFDRVMQVNLYGTFYCMKRAARIMLKQKYGRIISLSSVVGQRGTGQLLRQQSGSDRHDKIPGQGTGGEGNHSQRGGTGHDCHGNDGGSQ